MIFFSCILTKKAVYSYHKLNIFKQLKKHKNMDFTKINFLSKGTVRKSTEGITRESNFDFRYSHYTKVNSKTGLNETVNQFVFTRTGLEKAGLLSNDAAAVPFHDAENGIVGIAVVEAEKGVFLKPSKRSTDGKKSNTVSVPNLVTALAAEGDLDTTFEGAQYFDLVLLGNDNNGTYFKCVASAIAPKAYDANEVEVIK